MVCAEDKGIEGPRGALERQEVLDGAPEKGVREVGTLKVAFSAASYSTPEAVAMGYGFVTARATHLTECQPPSPVGTEELKE